MTPRSTLVKVAAFLVLSITCVVLLGMEIGGSRPPGPEYTALFTNSTELLVGVDVRAAGVTVGRVESIEVRPDNLVAVGFRVRYDVPLTDDTRATIRYQDVVGDRYLELSQEPGTGRRLEPGGIIPTSRTRPALDLDELFNGFAPLFQGLQPDQINQLAGSLVAVLQGQGDSVTRLLTQVGSLTGTLADKDAVIGHLVDNLNGLLATLDDHGGQLDSLVSGLTRLVGGLDADRTRIGRSLVGINDLTTSTSDLLSAGRPDIRGTVHQVDRLARVLNADRDLLDERLHKFPGYYAVLGRLGAYSSAFQFYLCGVQVRLHTGTGPVVRTPMIQSGARRCHY
ncbi:MAG TPA: MlaD family protein [Pseudonocardia sp.]|jgi:phospholipid/cholesterol/gamma-HCH transport system substrate-binding protein